MYDLNYAPITLGIQSLREYISGGTRKKDVKNHWSTPLTKMLHSAHIRLSHDFSVLQELKCKITASFKDKQRKSQPRKGIFKVSHLNFK